MQELLALAIVLHAFRVCPIRGCAWLPMQVIGSTLRFGLVAALGCFATGLLCLPSLASDDLRETCAELCSGIGHSLSGYAGLPCGNPAVHLLSVDSLQRQQPAVWCSCCQVSTNCFAAPLQAAKVISLSVFAQAAATLLCFAASCLRLPMPSGLQAPPFLRVLACHARPGEVPPWGAGTPATSWRGSQAAATTPSPHHRPPRSPARPTAPSRKGDTRAPAWRPTSRAMQML